MLISLNCLANFNSKPYERPVILSGSTETHVGIEAPLASFMLTGELQVNLDASHYSSYSIRLTPSDGGNDIVVPATTATVSIPITDTTTDYVVTVDGGNYGTYDGVFSPAGNANITLSDRQAMQLVKNRRVNNDSVDFYSMYISEFN